MSDRIVVTSAQVLAAQMQVRLANELGETLSPLVRRIAEAKARPKETDRIVVTSAQVLAAQMQVRLAEELGETVSPLVRRIAEAKPRPRGQRSRAADRSTESRPEPVPTAEPATQG